MSDEINIRPEEYKEQLEEDTSESSYGLSVERALSTPVRRIEN